jgi:sugar lactone lactonase YvrE
MVKRNSNLKSVKAMKMTKKAIAAIIGFAALWFVPGNAHGQIFVSNTGPADGADYIGAYTISGTAINTALISGLSAPNGIAVSAEKLVVANSDSGAVSQFTTSGGGSFYTISGLTGPLAVAVSGVNLYIANSDGTIGEYDVATGAVVTNPLVSGLNNPRGIAVSGGNLFVANFGNGTIGVYNATTGAPVNSALITGLQGPIGIAIDGGNLYVTNNANGTVGEYNATTGAPINTALISGLPAPVGIAVSGGHLFVVNDGTSSSGTIGEYDATTGGTINGTLISGLDHASGIAVLPEPSNGNLFASINGRPGFQAGAILQYAPDASQTTFASPLPQPRGLAFDLAGNLYFATTMTDNSNISHATIFKITPDGTQSVFATGFAGNFFFEDLVIDSAGNVFAAAGDGNDPNIATTIFKFTPAGTQSTFGSVPGQCFGIAFDAAGNLYAEDGVFQMIYEFTPDGTRTVFVGAAAFSSVQAPIGMAFDKFGNLFVSTDGNTPNDSILEFAPDGTQSTFATGLTQLPRGLAIDDASNLFVAETGNTNFHGDILKFTPQGVESVFASELGTPLGNGGAEFLTFIPFPVIVGGNVSATATVNQQFIYQIVASNHPTSYNASGLPTGLSIDTSTGVVFGIPSVSGTFSIPISASNSFGTGTGNLTLMVQPPPPPGPQIISSTAATGRTGQPFTFQILLSGASPSAQLTTSPLPAGLNFDSPSQMILGTPTFDGNFSITLTVTDGVAMATGTLQLTFTSDPTVPVVSSSGSATLTTGQPFSYTMTADAAGATFGYIGTDGQLHTGPSSAGLPSGLSFDGIDTISGIFSGPTLTGPQPKTITIRRPSIASIQLIATTADPGTTTTPLNFFAPSTLTASQPPDIVTEATGPSGAVVNFNPPTVTDLSGNNLSVSCGPASGSTFPITTTVVVCTSDVDSSGDSAVVTFNVTVRDTTPPTIFVPANITAEATGPNGAAVTFPPPTWTDIVDGSGIASCDHKSGDIYPLGTTTVTCSYTDAHGNTGTKSFTITVRDTTPPVITVPANITVKKQNGMVDHQQGAFVSFVVSATDLVDGPVPAVANPPSGSFFKKGTTTVSVTATDSHQNTATKTFTVRVK